MLIQEKEPKITEMLAVILDSKLQNKPNLHALANNITLTDIVIALLQEGLKQE